MLVKGKPCIVYDVESLKNIFTCTCKNTETGKIIVFEISYRKNDYKDMVDYFLNTDAYFVGYNNIHYDNIIMNCCIQYRNTNQLWFEITSSLNRLSQIIIDNNDDYERYKQFKFAKNFLTIDLLTLLFSKALRVSLKELQVTMHYKNVKEFVVDWKENLAETEFNNLISYNINDVESTEELLYKCQKDIDLRVEIEREYGLSCLSVDPVNLGTDILALEYMRETGIPWSTLKELRSPADTVDLNKVILPFVQFKSPELQAVLADMKLQTECNPGRKGYENTFLFGGMKITVGVGGIHGDCGTGIIKPLPNEKLVDSDVASLYPSMIIEHKFYPPHLGEAFLKIYSTIRTKRLAAKKAKNKIIDATLKLALNGLSGMLQNEYSWAYSPFTIMQVRINGQLLLLMLAEKLVEAGCQLKQINTDGILYILPKDKTAEVEKIKEEWQALTSLVLEDEEYKEFYQLAINDYFTIFLDDTVKQKGTFLTETYLGKGLSPTIVPEAIIAHFQTGVDVEDYIKSCTDIKKFLQSEKTGKQWTVEYNNQVQQRINRFYASTNGYYLWKWKWKDNTKSYSNMLKGYGVTILNELPEAKPIEEYNINYTYYIREAKKIIETLKPRQLSLW